ncbi:MAG TPA: VOC family protein, partial [Acidimicrobiales bacterium]|nr:VOC family protein [Acidimicrobiales bacterium]
MTTRLVSLTFDATDPLRLAQFWASALGWEIVDESGDEIGVLPTDGTQFIFVFVRVPEPKAAKNPIHLELVSESNDDQRAVV